ncbi:MAG: hypothetical protein QOJ54_31, partial [Aliidongia sp.]|nr:hypothetical protein [Aliidongia sp.]
MPLPSNILLCAGLAILLWTAIGWPLAHRILADRALALACAPALGWAVFNAAALPILLVAPFTRPVLAALVVGAVLVALTQRKASRPTGETAISWWAYGLAVLLALAPVIALLPKFVEGGVLLADPLYDHSKVSMIDDIARLGLPAGNPYYGAAGAPAHLGYYYLWHFGAAIFARLLGISGWEADIALTGVTAFASLALMMGLAVWFSGRRSAAFWVVILCAPLTMRPVLGFVLGSEYSHALLVGDNELEGWLRQAVWVPQHLASANAVLLALVLMARLTDRPSRLLVPVLALVVAAGFESSTWIGGVTFAAAALPVGAWLLYSAESAGRRRLLGTGCLAAALALVLVIPFLHDEYLATAARGIGVPIALHPYEVLGPFFPETPRRLLDLPGFWLIFLAIEFPAIYPVGVIALGRFLAAAETPKAARILAGGLALLAATGGVITWLFMSIIANNDLGWRAILPAVMVLTIFAAAGLSRWLAARAWMPAGAALLLALLGLPDALDFMRANATGIANPAAARFAQSPALWDAVRRLSAPDERVANNPVFMASALTWPVNISWALFADRRSCFVGRDLAQAYVALPAAEIERLEALFERIFAGDGTPDEIQALAERYQCRLIVVTPDDGAWTQDGFAASPFYRRV